MHTIINALPPESRARTAEATSPDVFRRPNYDCQEHRESMKLVVYVPGVEAAVMLHSGSSADSDQTYGALGTIVAERAIGIEGPIREYYLVPFTEPDLSRHRTEICWPVFQTA